MKKDIKEFLEFCVVVSLIFVSMWVVADKIILPYYKIWEYKTTMRIISQIADSSDDSPSVNQKIDEPLASEKQIKDIFENYDFKSMFSETK